MVKKHTKRNRQHGGWNPFSSSSPNTESYSSASPNTESYSSASPNTNTAGNILQSLNPFSGASSNTVGNMLQSLKKNTNTVTSWFTASATPVVNQPTNQQPMTAGKKAKSRKMKGGQGIAEYASPVNNLKVAEPTYWEIYGKGNIKSGGKKRKSQSTRKHNRRQTRRH
jgi:hypothetical protein